MPETDAAWLERVISLVATAKAVDLRSYRRPTLYRRIRWRMAMVGARSVQEFAESLATNPEEVEHAARAMFVGTTEMFRDRAPFLALERALPGLVARRRAEGARCVRAWVPASSTGAEAFSIAICLAEAVGAQPELTWRVLASDVDATSLAVAATGRIPADQVPPGLAAHLRRWLVPDGPNAFRVDPAVQQRISTAPHDVVNDRRAAPAAALFASFDVVSCRNLLIYLETDAQLDLCTRLLKACAPGGLLLLGNTERVPAQLLSHVHALHPGCLYVVA